MPTSKRRSRTRTSVSKKTIKCKYGHSTVQITPCSTIALLFLTKADHAHPDLWHSFLKGHEHQFRIFCHPYLPMGKNDKTPDGAQILDKCKSSFLHGNVISHRVYTKWGHLVNAYYALLNHAYKHAPYATRFVFLSETCVPVTTADEAYTTLISEPDITWMDAPQPKDNVGRYDNKRNKIDKQPVAPKLRRAGIDRKHFFKHSGWFALCRSDAKRLIAHPEAFRALNYVSAGDEHILSILRRRKYAQVSKLHNRPITYVYWDIVRKQKWCRFKTWLWHKYDTETDVVKRKRLADEIELCRHALFHPKEWKDCVTKYDLNNFKANGCLFARKIIAGCNVDVIQAALSMS